MTRRLGGAKVKVFSPNHMARFGETLFRFAGALLLAGAATMIDHPDMAKKGKRKPKPKPTMAVAVVSQGAGTSISRGMRGFGIRVPYDRSLAFALRPNDRVDVVAVLESYSGERIAKLYMANVRLLAIGTIKSERPMVVASIEVTPEEAERLALASSEASLRLVPHGTWDLTRARFDSALGAAVTSCTAKGPAESVLIRLCPPRNAPPEFVAPRR